MGRAAGAPRSASREAPLSTAGAAGVVCEGTAPWGGSARAAVAAHSAKQATMIGSERPERNVFMLAGILKFRGWHLHAASPAFQSKQSAPCARNE
jgi:hypothetical protein